MDANLLIQHTPALGHAGEQVRQALEGFPNNRRCWAVFLQFAFGIFMDTQVHKLAQVVEDIAAALFQVVQLALQVVKGGSRYALNVQRLLRFNRFQVREAVLHGTDTFAQGRQLALPLFNELFLALSLGGFLLNGVLFFLLQPSLFIQFGELLFRRLLFFGGVFQGRGRSRIALERFQIFLDRPDFFLRALNQLRSVVFLIGGVGQL